jgi:hypothetical protein
LVWVPDVSLRVAPVVSVWARLLVPDWSLPDWLRSRVFESEEDWDRDDVLVLVFVWVEVWA